jgi:hypothetical protein
MGPIIYLTSVFFGLALASDPPGMIGYGIKHFNPACASACAIPAQQGSLTCSTPGGMTFKENLMFMLTSPGCYASNTPYLTTVAYCIKQNCQGENIDLLEHFWRVKMTQTEGEVVPKWTYQQALLQVNGTPTGMVASMAPLNRTMLVSNATWSKFYNSFIVNEELEVTASKFSCVQNNPPVSQDPYSLRIQDHCRRCCPSSSNFADHLELDPQADVSSCKIQVNLHTPSSGWK